MNVPVGGVNDGRNGSASALFTHCVAVMTAADQSGSDTTTGEMCASQSWRYGPYGIHIKMNVSISNSTQSEHTAAAVYFKDNQSVVEKSRTIIWMGQVQRSRCLLNALCDLKNTPSSKLPTTKPHTGSSSDAQQRQQ